MKFKVKAPQSGSSKWKPLAFQIILIAIMSLAILVLPGSDIYTHLHQSWLYNHMVDQRDLLEKDFSMLSGNQPMYGVGVPSYIIAGAGWFFFQSNIVKILELLLFAGLIAVSMMMFRNREMLFFWYALFFVKMLLPDSYPYILSSFLFYLGILLIRKFPRTVIGDIAVSLAGLNHPYIAVSNLATFFLKRWTLFLTSVFVLLFQVFSLKFLFFSGTVSFEFDNIIDLAIRTAILFFPFMGEWLPKRLLRVASLKSAYALTIAGIVILYPLFFVPFEMGWKNGLACYYTESYSEIPDLPGNVRIVDDCRNWIYLFPVRGMVTSLSPYFEGQHYQDNWEEEKYVSYLEQTNTSYVIYCKDCEIRTKTLQPTGELEILRKNFPVYLELERYAIFRIKAE